MSEPPVSKVDSIAIETISAATPVEASITMICLRKQRAHDMKAIRDAMVEAIDNFDTYSVIANKEDEARLEGMRSMLTLFDVYQRWLEQL